MTLPDIVTKQDRLLTVSTSASKFLEGLLHPGIKDRGCDGMTYITPPLPHYSR